MCLLPPILSTSTLLLFLKIKLLMKFCCKKPPSYDHLRVFGCLAIASNLTRTIDKNTSRGFLVSLLVILHHPLLLVLLCHHHFHLLVLLHFLVLLHHLVLLVLIVLVNLLSQESLLESPNLLLGSRTLLHPLFQ